MANPTKPQTKPQTADPRAVEVSRDVLKLVLDTSDRDAHMWRCAHVQTMGHKPCNCKYGAAAVLIQAYGDQRAQEAREQGREEGAKARDRDVLGLLAQVRTSAWSVEPPTRDAYDAAQDIADWLKRSLSDLPVDEPKA